MYPKDFLHGVVPDDSACVRAFDNYFMMKKYITEIHGFSSIHKCTPTMRILAYGVPADAKEEYLHISKSTT
jgi:hypothetical protein